MILIKCVLHGGYIYINLRLDTTSAPASKKGRKQAGTKSNRGGNRHEVKQTGAQVSKNEADYL